MTPDDGTVLEVFADIWCPFAHVGLRAVEEQRARAGRPEVAIVVRAWPLELVNGRPLDPATTEEHADDLRAQVAPDLFAHLDTDHFPTSTLEALALAHRGYRSGAATGERVSFALRDALFEEGRDISDPRVLADLARDLGVVPPDDTDRAAVLDDWAEGTRRGVRGSPHFFGGGSDMFCPSLDISRRPDDTLDIARDAARLTAFLESCLARPAGGGAGTGTP